MSAVAGTRYYGAIFWLSLVTFAVPLVVAFKAFDAVRPTTKPTPNPDASGVDHALWDYLLKAHVENGQVDYDGMARDHLFRTYLRQIGSARPCDLATRDEQLAFYCNAYNALVINGVIIHRIKDSVMSYKHAGVGFFDAKEHLVAGKTVSLNDLEHKIIRPTFDDPRVHFSLVCGARGCPPIRPEAYCGRCLNLQLDDQASQFCNNPKSVAYDAPRGAVVLNPIVKWYADDWKAPGGVLPWLAGRVDDAALRDALRRAAEGKAAVAYSDYDWALNSRDASPATAGEAKPANFGSGTVPNQ